MKYLLTFVLVLSSLYFYSSQSYPQQRKTAPKRISPEKKNPVRVNPDIGKAKKFTIMDPGGGVIPLGADSLVSNELKCVDPKVEAPPYLKAPTEDDTQSGKLDLGFRTKTKTGYAVNFNKVKKFATAPSPKGASSCVTYSNDQFYGNGTVPNNMPSINFPKIDCEGLDRCIKARLGWMQAHHHVWRARQMIHTIAAEDNKSVRSYLWNQPGAKDGEKLSEKTSPAYWFGPYEDYRLHAIKQAYDKVWNIFTSNKTGGITLKLRCPDTHLNPANVCFSTKPSAHHWVKGVVDLCSGFFTGNSVGDQWFRAETTMHELWHHLFLTYNHNGPKLVAIQDNHTHGHGATCLGDVKTHPHYGEGNVRHLATYRHSSGKRCGHLERNIRNNDTYALFATTIGHLVYTGGMDEWPAPSTPTPQAPTDCDTGDEGCYCEDENSWPLNEYFEPDGDFSEDKWCDDNDGEMTCVKTAFGAGNNKGICTKCDDVRGPGCECSNTQQCDVGSCFGDDTFGNGVGHCFKDPPPDWACLADCKKLFNSSAAWCYYDYPTGKARCMDHLCSKPEAYNCHVYQDGKVCRYGNCVVECNNNFDCQTKGYPSNFECVSHRCEYAY